MPVSCQGRGAGTADHLYEFAKARIAEIEFAVLEVTLS
jgi:hypothetical protein